jgi:wyosine [tRNA(Phe)-imidazoG37] synthetase (radical SAM superfamily)
MAPHIVAMMATIQNQRSAKKVGGNGNGRAPAHSLVTHEVAFGYPRDFLENQFVYLVISPRAGGLSIGVNVNPIVKCNLNCLYCEIDRARPARVAYFDVKRMAAELHGTFGLAHSGRLRERPRYANLPDDLLQVRHVALSGDGEPTLSSHFVEALQAIAHLRVLGGFPFFKIVLVTNSTALDWPRVQYGLKFLTRTDEIWAKLDGGTQEYLNRLNGATIRLEKIMANILLVARQRPVVIQSLFPAIDGAHPPAHEIRQYAQRLKELKEAGAEISLVQIYSATRPMAGTGCSHLPLKSLSQIAQTVRRVAGLRAEVF